VNIDNRVLKHGKRDWFKIVSARHILLNESRGNIFLTRQITKALVNITIRDIR